MTCFYPIFLKDLDIYVPCGKCKACRLVYVQNLVERGKHEALQYSCNLFVTLTYSDEYLPSDYQLCYSDFQCFMKRFRKYSRLKGFKYLACGEYGGSTGRPHFHFIGFGLDKSYLPILRKAWRLGHITCDIALPSAVGYIAKYALKTKKEVNSELSKYGVDVTPPMVKWSKGLGRSWLEARRNELSKDLSYLSKGKTKELNRYYWSLLNYSRNTKADFSHPCRNHLKMFRDLRNHERIEKALVQNPECKGNVKIYTVKRSLENASKILGKSQIKG